MGDEGGDKNLHLVKALRQKCDDLEDQLDAEVEKAANAASAQAALERANAELREAHDAERARVHSLIAEFEVQREALSLERDAEMQRAEAVTRSTVTSTSELEEVRIACASQERSCQDLQSRSDELAQQMAVAKQSAEALASELEEEKAVCATHKHTKEDLQSRYDELTGDIEVERQSAKALASELEEEKAVCATHKHTKEDLQSRYDELTGDIEVERQSAKALASELEEEKAVCATHKHTKEDLQSRYDELTSDIDVARQSAKERTDEETRVHLANLTQERGNLQDEVERIKSELQATNAAREEDRIELHRAEEERDSQRSRVDAFAENADALQNDAGKLESAQEEAEVLKERVLELAGELERLTSAELEDSARWEEDRCQLERSLVDAQHAEGRVLGRSQEVAELTDELQQLRVMQQESEERASVLSGELDQLQSATLEQSRLWDQTKCQLERSLADARQMEGTKSNEEVAELAEESELLRVRLQESEARRERALTSELEAHGVQRERAEELEAELAALRPAHAELSERHSAAAAEVGRLRSEHEEMGSLRAQLEEMGSRGDGEPPQGPTQLTVSDVLISIVFESVEVPLELRPWDTNLEDVVTRWLSAARRSSNLTQSLVRYLRHLEETSEAFPVRLEAVKLLEVHEQFAL